MANENEQLNATAPEATGGKTKKETVTIERDKLEAILNRIDRLESAASKAGLSKYDLENKEIGSKVVHLGLMDGKVIISWQMTKNSVEKNGNNVWVEDQKIELTFEDGDTLELPYVFFGRRVSALPAEVTGEKLVYGEDAKRYGGKLFDVRTRDGKTYSIGEKFLNPAGGPGMVD